MKSTYVVLALVVSCMTTTLGVAEEKIDPSGAWRWEYEMQGETIKDSLSLNLEKEGKVVGTFTGRNNTVEIKEGKLEGDKLSVAFPIEFQGNKIDLNFTGTVKGDDIDGTVSIEANGETYEFPWKPKRSVMLDDVVGTWQIRIETTNGNVFEPTLEISKDGEDYKTVYTSMQGYELNVKDLRVKQNNLMFTVTAEFDGNTLKVDYKGRPYGNKMQGTLEYEIADNTGEGEFSAKRKVKEDKEQK